MIPVRKASYLKRPATPRFARKAALPIPACRNGPDPNGQEKLVKASEETLALHQSYGRAPKVRDPTQWNQSMVPCDKISGERLSRKSRPQRGLRFREGDVTRVRIVSRWIAEVAQEDSEPEENSDSEEEEEDEGEFEPEDVSLSEEMSLPNNVLEDWEDDSYDWAKAIKDSLEKKIF